ncbi:MAG: oxygen-independent coproporphyrinogen III oxidase [Wenzhouxiangellaceae bacterium]
MGNSRPEIDDQLIAKYGGPGPRYTSYPTALEFSVEHRAEALIAALHAGNHELIPADLSVYVHVPFCASPCFYCGCNKVITRSSSIGDEYLRHLALEVQRLAAHVASDRKVRQIHLGGGTPTFLNLEQIEQLLTLISDHLVIALDAEISLEIDPRSVTADGLHRLAGMGFNRLSMGVQDLDQRVQQAVNRVHGEQLIDAQIKAARAAGFASISVDLIYGLPHQTRQSFADTMARMIAMRPDRLSLFNYAHMPHKFKAQRQIKAVDLPDADTKLAIFHQSMDQLLAAGYEYIGMDHFALPEDALARARQDGSMVRNFQGYSTLGDLDLLAFGPSAISQVGDTFSQNLHEYRAWCKALAATSTDNAGLAVMRGLTRSAEDRLRADVINAIMCRGALDFASVEAAHNIDFELHFAAELERLQALQHDGLIRFSGRGLRITPVGQQLLRAIAMVFDSYIHAARSRQTDNSVQRFSRVI